MGKNLCLVGCGAMGSALLHGWLNRNTIEEFWVVSPHKTHVKPFADNPRIKYFKTPEALPGKPNCIVFALKPDVLEVALTPYKKHMDHNTLVVSVATGKTLKFYQDTLGHSIIRAMPNTPVSNNNGVIAFYADAEVKEHWEEETNGLFAPLGLTTWVSEEDHLTIVTALSGSGPAYVFNMIEAMTEAGVSMGLTQYQARLLALHTVAGAGAYAVQSSQDVSTLREAVTSPGGTTEKALEVLMDGNGLECLMKRAILAAERRGKELAK